ncbi:radical SAM protein, partial [bacterium]|nr:radical SAM protein [bacterium]
MSSLLEEAVRGAQEGYRLSWEEGISLFADAALPVLGLLANEARLRHNPENLGTFVVDENLNYTNVCNVLCKFCAFYTLPKTPEAYDLTLEQILERVEALVAEGGTQLLLQGGVNPQYRLRDYLRIFKAVSTQFPTVDIHSLSSAEIEWVAKKEGMTYREVFGAMKEAGYKSMPGAGAEILVDRVRKEISPLRSSRDKWL